MLIVLLVSTVAVRLTVDGSKQGLQEGMGEAVLRWESPKVQERVSAGS